MHQSANRKELDANSNWKNRDCVDKFYFLFSCLQTNYCRHIRVCTESFILFQYLNETFHFLTAVFYLILAFEWNIRNLFSYPVHFLTAVWIIWIKTSGYQQFKKLNNTKLQQNFAPNQHIHLISVVVGTIIYCQWRNKTYQCDVCCLARNQLTVHVALLSMTSYFMSSSSWSGCYTGTIPHPTSLPRSFNFLIIPSENLQRNNNNPFTLPRQPSNLAHPASLMSRLPMRLSRIICE